MDIRLLMEVGNKNTKKLPQKSPIIAVNEPKEVQVNEIAGANCTCGEESYVYREVVRLINPNILVMYHIVDKTLLSDTTE